MKTRTQDQKITYKKLDMVTHAFNELLEVGKTYRLGIAHAGYLFSHYVTVTIGEREIHNDWQTSYGCHHEAGTYGYLWTFPRSRSMTRIISAELI